MTDIDMTWPSADNPAAQLPTLPTGRLHWDEAARHWAVDDTPVSPGWYLRDGERIKLIDPDNPDDLII